MEISNSRAFAAEVVGTTVLMIGGPGSAILAGDRIGTLGIALAFGFSLLIMAYALGHVTGANINPAVTLGLVLTRKLTWGKAVYFWVGQFVGAALGGLIIFAIANNIDGFSSKNNFAQNGWGQYSPGGYGIVAAMFVEVVFTALLVYVVLSTTAYRFPVGFGGIAAGLTLALIHLVTIPVDNTSVNPARSFGSAIFAGTNALVAAVAVHRLPAHRRRGRRARLADDRRGATRGHHVRQDPRRHRGPRRGRQARRQRCSD